MSIVKTFLNENSNMAKAFDYIDRDNHPNIVQRDMFKKLQSVNDIDRGDKFISPKEGNYAGMVDKHKKVPVLLTCKWNDQTHIRIEGGGSIAYDLCYKLIN